MGLDQYLHYAPKGSRKTYEHNRKVENEIDLIDESREEIDDVMYWRKKWNLHAIIIKVVGEIDGEDNCVRFYLTADDIKEIIRQIGLMDDDEYPNKFKDISVFNDAIEAIKSGKEVFYYPWY